MILVTQMVDNNLRLCYHYTVLSDISTFFKLSLS